MGCEMQLPISRNVSGQFSKWRLKAVCSNEFRCARSWEQHCCLLVTTLSITPHGLQCCCSSQIRSVAQWFEGVRHLKNLSTLHNRMFEFDYNSRTVHQFDQSNGVSLPTRQELLNEHNFELKKKKKNSNNIYHLNKSLSFWATFVSDQTTVGWWHSQPFVLSAKSSVIDAF